MYLIPQPKKTEFKEGICQLTYESCLVVDASCADRLTAQAGMMCRSLGEELGFSPMLIRGKGREGDIILRQTGEDSEEGYCLLIGEEKVEITGGAAGIWHGLQTLLQIVMQCGSRLPQLSIEDAPDIPNRGFYHDVTRGRIPKLSFLKKLVDQMSFYKMNQLQLYVEHTYLFRDLTELWRDDTPLTAEDILELDRYCAERNVELVPSLSSFGHLYKLLSSKTYSHLCELEDSQNQPFSLMGRMQHHVINVTDPESLELVKSMIAEFCPLFTSKQFNICADETFDLGKGKSQKAAKEKGLDRIYIDFVRQLCEYVISLGRRPMFWGDIICGFPELIRELPPETICLTWGYAPDQSEESSRKMYEAGAVQYTCPGTNGWNHLMYPYRASYENISRMCSYAMKYGSLGVLNTDWGDFLHVDHPEHGIVGMIYGAAFSWNSRIPEFEEMNRQISRIAFGDRTEKIVEILAEAEGCDVFCWDRLVRYKESVTIEERAELNRRFIAEGREGMEKEAEADRRLCRMKERLCENACGLPADIRSSLKSYLVAADGIRLCNKVGLALYDNEFGRDTVTAPDAERIDAKELASRLEKWLYHYKEIYRSVSREAELYRIQELVLWYADYLRTRA